MQTHALLLKINTFYISDNNKEHGWPENVFVTLNEVKLCWKHVLYAQIQLQVKDPETRPLF